MLNFFSLRRSTSNALQPLCGLFSICMCTRIHIYTYTCTHGCTYTACMFLSRLVPEVADSEGVADIHIYTYTCTHRYKRTHTHAHLHTYVCACRLYICWRIGCRHLERRAVNCISRRLQALVQLALGKPHTRKLFRVEQMC